MAFAITNKVFVPSDDSFVPKTHSELADQTAAANTDTGIVGLRWWRIRVMVKSGMANTNTVLFALRVGTGASVTSPELVATSPTYTFVTGDTNLMWEATGFSQTGFQSWKLTPTNGTGTASYDIMFDAA